MNDNREMINRVMEQINSAVLGKEEKVKEVMTAFLAGGHVLLEDLPGTGKTSLALAFSRAMKLDYRRLQLTPDVLPSDLTGFSIYRRDTERFVYQPGSVFCNLLLADEINRTSPKTQSALLEVMEEGKVTVEGITRQMPRPFLVIATQNPFGSAGTQRMPASQMDRFMVCLSMGYLDFDDEVDLAMGTTDQRAADRVQAVLEGEILLKLQHEISELYMSREIASYIVRLVQASRSHPMTEQGASARGTIALVRTAKAAAWLSGRDYVAPRDVEEQFPYVMGHRLQLSRQAELEQVSRDEILRQILSSVPKPSLRK